MKYLSKLILFFLFGNGILFAHAPDTAWTKTYGGIENDRGRSVQQTTDGGYIVAGGTYSYGNGESDVYLIKTDSLGDTLWTKTYGGTEYESGISIQQTTEKGYIIAVFTAAADNDVYLIKTDSLGDTLWTKTYGDTNNNTCRSVQQTIDGGYIVVGLTHAPFPNDDVYLMKTNFYGDSLWARTYRRNVLNIGMSVQQTTDGGYIVAGGTEGWGAEAIYDVYLIKTNYFGDTLWTKTYGGTEDDIGYSVQQTTDGGYIVAGYTYSYGEGERDVYLIKTDSLGDSLWTRTYGGAGDDRGYSVQQTTDGGYIVAGSTGDFYLIKTDSTGDTLWTGTYGGSSNDNGYSVQQTTDGGYIVVGETYSYGTGNYDVYLIKIKPESSGIKEKISSGLLSLSLIDPNPFTTKTTVKYTLTKATDVSISIYNLLGQEVKKLYSGKQSPGVHSISWDGNGNSGKLPTGIYLLRIKAGYQEDYAKLTFIR